MAKELPFFKFEPSLWDTGNIQLCSREDKGLFIDICSIYWQRLGNLPEKLVVQKLCGGNAIALRPLCDSEIIKVIDGMICIDFLNEQLFDFQDLRNKNTENARKRWQNKAMNATAMRPQCDRNAIREEETREDIYTYGVGNNFILILPKTLHSPKARINGGDGLAAFMEANQSILNLPQYADKFMRYANGKVYNDMMHVRNAYDKFIEKNPI